MKCLICQKPIAPRATRTYVTVKAAATSHPRKVYACEHCQAEFDKWIDSRAVDSDGVLFDFQAAVTTPAAPVKRKRRKYAEGRCDDCGHIKPVTKIKFWATGMPYTVCSGCIKPYRGEILKP